MERDIQDYLNQPAAEKGRNDFINLINELGACTAALCFADMDGPEIESFSQRIKECSIKVQGNRTDEVLLRIGDLKLILVCVLKECLSELEKS